LFFLLRLSTVCSSQFCLYRKDRFQFP